MKNKIVYLLLLVQIIAILISPRFGWEIHNYDSTVFQYAKTLFVDGEFHSQYINDEKIIDICYDNIFSKRFNITVDNTDVYYMEVGIDGEVIDYEPEMLSFTGNDIVWNDACGILGWRYILTIVMTLLSIRLFNLAKANDDRKRKKIFVCAVAIYVISMLISLRILL